MKLTSHAYDNDETMADLGRILVDMLIGQRARNIPEERIAASLVVALDDYIEDETDDQTDLAEQ